jgi:hypothetical protein
LEGCGHVSERGEEFTARGDELVARSGESGQFGPGLVSGGESGPRLAQRVSAHGAVSYGTLMHVPVGEFEDSAEVAALVGDLT